MKDTYTLNECNIQDILLEEKMLGHDDEDIFTLNVDSTFMKNQKGCYNLNLSKYSFTAND